jgi:hypothetical protein
MLITNTLWNISNQKKVPNYKRIENGCQIHFNKKEYRFKFHFSYIYKK